MPFGLRVAQPAAETAARAISALRQPDRRAVSAALASAALRPPVPPLDRCYCGSVHIAAEGLCSGVALGSALEIQRYCEGHSSSIVPAHSVGELDHSVCPHCRAVQFRTERLNCCSKGAVCVPVPDVPDVLHSVICSPEVLRNIRVYNMALSMASTGHQNMSPNYGMFVLGGKSYHRIAAQFVHPQAAPGFAQIYILDTASATDRRMAVFPARQGAPKVNASILAQLHDLLVLHNPWIGQYRSAGRSEVAELSWSSCGSKNMDGMGLGAVCDGYGSRHIVLRHSAADCGFTSIDDAHELYHPLAYVLLFPTGAVGWSGELSRLNENLEEIGSLSLHQWARYLIMRRLGGLSHLQRCAALTSEFWCDVWAQIESRNLGYLRRAATQHSIRSSHFAAVDDAIDRHELLGQVGTPVWMPASFVGSAKWYRGLFHDAMMLPTRFDFPDLFITMTCNPKWEEILNNVPAGADPHDFPDIVARVFYAKWMALLHDIVVGMIFGKVVAFCWRVEWQFRGWPHVHAMFILARKLLSAQQIDGVVSAEIPDPAIHPELYKLVTDLMIHGPFCGDSVPASRCREDNAEHCKYRFPKSPQTVTTLCSGHFPLYRRRCLHSAQVRGHTISDEWVVSYNALLLLRYGCHINLEVCGHLKVIKYCFKYIFKAPDCATVCIDEIEHFISSRVISAGEAVWRILGLKLHQEFPPVQRLDLHLPQHHRVVFDAAADPQQVQLTLGQHSSTLLQWFLLNTRDIEARQLLYADIPGKYTWHNHSWQPRRRDCQVIGRIHMVGSTHTELFFLRRLLCVVRGARSFVDLCTVQGELYPTFKETCLARGMLVDDAEYIQVMQDMVNVECSVDALRREFACLVVRCNPANSRTIFEMFLPELCGVEFPDFEDIECSLWAMECFANELGHSLQEYGWALPALRMIVRHDIDSLDVHEHNREVAYSRFSAEQLRIAEEVIAAVASGHGGIFYLQAGGGCGKSFWANGVSAALSVQGRKPIMVAASALAASVLRGGRTAHAMFHIPIECDEHSFCSFSSETLDLMKSTNIIFWDECSMVHVDVAECVNRSLQDVSKSSLPFGGKVVVFMGDFQQLLPVVRHGNGDACTIMRAKWWSSVQILRLTRNFRSDDPDYCQMLHAVGMGIAPSIVVPPECMASSIGDLVDRVFEQDFNAPGRHIVTTTLDAAAIINAFVIDRLPGVMESAVAADEKVNCKDDLYSDEFIHSLSLPGSPPAVLQLKIGARYMILRNFDPQRSIINGVEVSLLAIRPYSLTVRLPSGKTAVIPRINFFIEPAVSGLPFTLIRRQFPLIPAYALTVHRVQGQSLRTLGLYVTGDMFCHGMLYTCLSRVGSWERVSVWCEDDCGPFELRNLVRPHAVAHLW